MMRSTISASIVALLAAAPLQAQNSAYGVLGIGFPSAPFGTAARAMGGGPSATDPQSFVNPAALGNVPSLFVQAASMQEFRSYSIGSVNASGLRQNRFPYAVVAGPLGPRFVYSLGFDSYAERTYSAATDGTITIRGQPVGFSDRIGSSGGIADIRAAGAWSPNARVSVGFAWHFLTGSAKVTTSRSFTDPVYRSFSDVVDARYSGYGASAGVMYARSTRVRLGASVRMDTKLNREVGEDLQAQVSLPVTLAGGAEFRPTPLLRVAATGAFRTWSRADADLAVAGTNAFNTIDLGLGVEMGGAAGGPPLPIRLGVRFATLPFSPTTDQPREVDLTAGTGLRMAAGRAHLDFTVERVMRDGGGASERAWQLTAGFHVRP